MEFQSGISNSIQIGFLRLPKIICTDAQRWKWVWAEILPKRVKPSKIKFDSILYLSGCGCSRRLENYSPTVQYYVRNLLWSFNLEFSKPIRRLPKASIKIICTDAQRWKWGNFAKRVKASEIKIWLNFVTYVSINSTVNQQKLPFSNPTHLPLCWRNTWMVHKASEDYLHWCSQMEMSLSGNLSQ